GLVARATPAPGRGAAGGRGPDGRGGRPADRLRYRRGPAGAVRPPAWRAAAGLPPYLCRPLTPTITRPGTRPGERPATRWWPDGRRSDPASPAGRRVRPAGRTPDARSGRPAPARRNGRAAPHRRALPVRTCTTSGGRARRHPNPGGRTRSTW